MPQEIKAITVPLPYKLGTVNCYLVKTQAGYILIDTGGSNQRTELEQQLRGAGCQPGDLKLIALTHGDFDHTGNAAYLREKLGAKIAMHRGDAGMAERGDMFWNRKSSRRLIKMMAPILFRFGQSNRFEPDLYLEEGTTLSDYGFDATVLSIPGHSLGSVGILTAGGDLFCGDLLDNTRAPALNSIMDDPAAAAASLGRLKRLAVNTVYPGHGRPFTLDRLAEGNR